MTRGALSRAGSAAARRERGLSRTAAALSAPTPPPRAARASRAEAFRIAELQILGVFPRES